MINYHQLRLLYNKLYVELRRYIWGFREVEAIASLEIACYETCPDMNRVRDELSKLEILIRDVIRDDPDLKKAYDKFVTDIENESVCETKIPRVTEVLQT